MDNAIEIKPHQAVLDCNDVQIAIVDHMEGLDTIKLAKGDGDSHHYIPVSWVESVDDKVHLSVAASEATKQWATHTPDEAAATPS